MYQHDSSFHRLKVSDANGVRNLKFERNQQSSMRLDDPFETDIEYVAYFHLAVAIRPEIENVLMIGLGGGSLAKQFWRDYPWMRIHAIEIDPDVVDVAYELFELPRDERIRVSVGDGRRLLAASDELFDLIVVDAYDDDRVPPHLLTDEFLREIRAHLAEGGVVAYNLIGSLHGNHSRPFRSFLRTAENVWRNTWVFPVGLETNGPIQLAFGCNIIVFGSDTNLTESQLMSRIASRVGGRVRVKGFALLGEDFYQGKVRSGDVPILTDPPVRSRRR
jgi:spermidine synthase